MNIIFCHAGKAHMKALEAVREYAIGAVMIDTSSSDTRYWEVLGRYWTGEEDLMTIEQDIEIAPDAVKSFSDCPEPWCSYRYMAMRGWVLDKSLGCSKFSAEMQVAVPFDEMSNFTLTQMPGVKLPSGPKLTWKYCDYRIMTHLQFNGFKPHVHGEVKHYHPYPIGATNAIIQEAVEYYLSHPTEDVLADVQAAMDYANSGELNANPLLLYQQKAFA